MTLPEVTRVDLEHPQKVADKLREGASMIVDAMPEIATMLNIGAEQIEGLCDTIRAGEQLILEMRNALSDDSSPHDDPDDCDGE